MSARVTLKARSAIWVQYQPAVSPNQWGSGWSPPHDDTPSTGYSPNRNPIVTARVWHLPPDDEQRPGEDEDPILDVLDMLTGWSAPGSAA